eukprot:3165357-Rhodomonas_salina.2
MEFAKNVPKPKVKPQVSNPACLCLCVVRCSVLTERAGARRGARERRFGRGSIRLTAGDNSAR